MDIELRLSRSFVQMHELGSIARAADRLACTQAAMSMRLTMLETELGAPLFLRGPYGLDPTPRGAELYAKSLGVRSAYDEMLSTPRSRPARARVRLGLPDDCALGRLGPVLSRLSLDLVEIDITRDPSAHLMAGVQRAEIDLALVTLAARPAQARAEAQVPLVCVGQASPCPLRLAAYPESCVFRRAMIATLDGAGRPWQVAVLSRAHAGIFAAIRAGIAVTSVARGTAPADLIELESSTGLPSLPPVPVYLVGSPSPRPAAARIEAALMDHLCLTPV